MLLHTIDWWPVHETIEQRAARAQLGLLFPAATFEETARTLIDAEQWSLCRVLYDHVLYRELLNDRISIGAALALGTTSARLVSYWWPEPVRECLTDALAVVTDFAAGRRVTRRFLDEVRHEAVGVAKPWLRAAAPAGPGTFAVRSAISVLRTAARDRLPSSLAPAIAEAAQWAAEAAAAAARNGRDGATAANSGRADAWQCALLYLEVVCTEPLAERV